MELKGSSRGSGIESSEFSMELKGPPWARTAKQLSRICPMELKGSSIGSGIESIEMERFPLS